MNQRRPLKPGQSRSRGRLLKNRGHRAPLVSTWWSPMSPSSCHQLMKTRRKRSIQQLCDCSSQDGTKEEELRRPRSRRSASYFPSTMIHQRPPAAWWLIKAASLLLFAGGEELPPPPKKCFLLFRLASGVVLKAPLAVRLPRARNKIPNFSQRRSPSTAITAARSVAARARATGSAAQGVKALSKSRRRLCNYFRAILQGCSSGTASFKVLFFRVFFFFFLNQCLKNTIILKGLGFW